MGKISERVGRTIASRLPRVSAAAAYVRQRKKRFIGLFLVIAHTAGALTSVRAIMATRTPQGAVAWAVSLNSFPYLAVPAYWIFGSRKFDGEVTMRRGDHEKSVPILSKFVESAQRQSLLAPGRDETANVLLERLARIPATTGNDVELLRNGEVIFPSILEGIDSAQHYVLVQFYIVRDDTVGRRLKERLIAAVKRGVKVHFVYDEVGSQKLSDSYVAELIEGGVEILPFNTNKGKVSRFQLNFRNHRKTVITDGRAAWVGGANVGDEYNGAHEKLTPWHDTMVKVTGPAVQTIQFAFWEDWLWASDRDLNLQWEPQPAASGAKKSVLCISSGPADPVETCTLYFLQHINSATKRLWISSPYFVPDEQIITALELAAMRGVDVRILVPDEGDAALVDLSGWAFVARLGRVGVKFYRHRDGFIHQKVTLVDSALATVGSANFDNRSFRLNFETTIEVRDESFNREVSEMLETDFAQSRLVNPREVSERGFLFQLKVRAASLLSPIQ